MKRNVKLFIGYIFFIFIITIFFVAIYVGTKFDNIPFEQLLFTLRFSKGANKDIIIDGIIYVLPRVLFTIIFFIIIQFLIKKKILDSEKKLYLNIKIKNKIKRYRLLNYSIIKRIILYFAFSFLLLLFSFKQLRIDEYIFNKLQKTTIYEDYYVEADKVNISFNENKKNLIYIVVESEEMTNASIENGGGVEKSYIPNLERLAQENTNFSNTEKLGGALQLSGMTYTAASLVSQTSGTPVSIFIDGNLYHGFSDSYPGTYTIGEVLEKNGYSNYFLLGSDSNFGGRVDYYTKHGNYKIMDYYYAIDNNWIDKNYNVWWGYEDKKLFEFAKKELTEISKQNKPFNFTILTADTHFLDGYYDETCGPFEFPTQYESVFYCNDRMLNDFISWIKEQDFYNNTTIVITGDHLTMQGDFYKNLNPNYKRTIYNTIINSFISDNKYTKNRLFSVLDLYPTTLAALGATIDGDTLGFGVNLYSGKPTIIEQLGEIYVGTEFSKNSIYYNDKILGKTYYDANKK